MNCLKDLRKAFKDLRLEVVPERFLASLEVQRLLLDRIKENHKGDEVIEEIKEDLKEGKAKGF